jgi:hypothetical protein
MVGFVTSTEMPPGPVSVTSVTVVLAGVTDTEMLAPTVGVDEYDSPIASVCVSVAVMLAPPWPLAVTVTV